MSVPEWTTWREVAPAAAPAVSVILAADERDVDLEVRLPSALNQTVQAHEVVVIDSSADGRHFAAVARLEQAESRIVIRYLRAAAATPAAIRALGSRIAAGNVRAFVGGGTILPSRWIEHLIRAIRPTTATLANPA